MTPTPYVPLGRVVKTHGLKGEVSVALAQVLPFVIPIGLEVWFVPPPASVRTGTIESVRPGPKGPLLKITGVDDVDQAAAVCGTDILARRDSLPEEFFALAAEEFDAVGMRVRDLERGALGEVVETIVTGANDVWVVEGPFGEVLLPVIDDILVEIDNEAGEIVVRLLPGLLPDDADDA